MIEGRRSYFSRWALIGILAWVAAGQPAGAATAPPLQIDAKFARIDQRIFYGPAGVYFPEQAIHAGVSGVATLECTVGLEGTLDACALVSQTPPGFDFGGAALRMAEAHAITAGVAADGARPAAGQIVRVRAPFELPR